MTTAQVLEEGRRSFRRQAWADARTQLATADAEAALPPDDLERLAVASYLVGCLDESAQGWERAHLEWLRSDVARAVRCAFWLGLGLVQQGERARGGGWLARAGRLLNEADLDCAEHGYLRIPAALQTLEGGDAAGATAIFEEASRIGNRFQDPDLMTLSRLGLGRCMVADDRVAEGMALLDEAMVGVLTGETSPLTTGIAYCTVILVCRQAFDLSRAQEWTAALDRWSHAQQGLVPFRGQCLVHRSQLLQLRGEWTDAMTEARLARDRLSAPRIQPALGMAQYQLAELHRLRGEFAEAEQGYRAAGERGRDPQPGLALLRLWQGRVDDARHAIRRTLDTEMDRTARAEMLPAYVEISLASHDQTAAQSAADELTQLAEDLGFPMLHALSAHTTGAVLLSAGDHRAACDALHRSLRGWQQLDAPYEVARVRVLLGLAYRELGDLDTATLELDAARGDLQELGAVVDLARIERLVAGSAARGGLTGREIEVLAMAARGRTNREIADELTLSEHTVRRHLQNVFHKLGVSSRAAATSYAFQHDLI